MTTESATASAGIVRLGRALNERVTAAIATFGQIVVFVGKTFALLPTTIRHYRKQTLKTMNDMAWGSGSIIVDGGVVSLMFFLGIAVGSVVAIMAFMAFDLLGFGALTGIINSFGNIRVVAPIITGIGFAAQAGCRMTAEIGAMRISEEIDATETMGLRAIPFVVGTRLIGGMLVVLPSYLMALVVSFITGGLIVKLFHDQPEEPTTTTSRSSSRYRIFSLRSPRRSSSAR